MVNRVPKIAKKSRKNAACLLTKRIMLAQKALASVAIEGNRLAERLLADIAADKGEEVLAFLDSDESAKNVPAKVPRNVLQNVPVNDCRVLKNLLLPEWSVKLAGTRPALGMTVREYFLKRDYGFSIFSVSV